MAHAAVYPTGLTVDTVDWTRTDGRIWARVTAGLYDGLEVRGRDYTIPSAAGQVPFGRLAHERSIRAEGMIQGVGADEAAQRLDFLATRRVMDGLMRGDQDPYSIVHTAEGGALTATISARPFRIEWGPDFLPTFREFTAYWVAVGDATALTPPDWDWSDIGS